jgi:adenosylcobinamide kinase/adenosylcobinamide-phosphate guanylyltransferase
MTDHELTLILGGARSGKSTYAERLAAETGDEVLFVATAQALDDEMRERITAHRAARPLTWRTLEAPQGVAQAIRTAEPAPTILLDCITLLVSNTVLAFGEEPPNEQAEQAVMHEIGGLLDVWREVGGRWIVISNEVGMGVVPPYKLGRVYRDVLGRANQTLAREASRVVLMVAGLPWELKGG